MKYKDGGFIFSEKKYRPLETENKKFQLFYFRNS